ncbi:MAG: alternative oxidase [Pseudomonadota bacterium]
MYVHRSPTSLRDRIALSFVKALRGLADLFFRKRYGHRAVVLETVAAVPGLVGGLLQHLKSLRNLEDDDGWIRELLEEAENERMHLMTFVQVAQPSILERALIMGAQAVFFVAYFLVYLLSAKTAHRVVGYFEEEAVRSYSSYLVELEAGRLENSQAPEIAVTYWNLAADARLTDVVRAVRDDEAGHRDRNHAMADALLGIPTPDDESASPTEQPVVSKLNQAA